MYKEKAFQKAIKEGENKKLIRLFLILKYSINSLKLLQVKLKKLEHESYEKELTFNNVSDL